MRIAKERSHLRCLSFIRLVNGKFFGRFHKEMAWGVCQSRAKERNNYWATHNYEFHWLWRLQRASVLRNGTKVHVSSRAGHERAFQNRGDNIKNVTGLGKDSNALPCMPFLDVANRTLRALSLSLDLLSSYSLKPHGPVSVTRSSLCCQKRPT